MGRHDETAGCKQLLAVLCGHRWLLILFPHWTFACDQPSPSQCHREQFCLQPARYFEIDNFYFIAPCLQAEVDVCGVVLVAGLLG